MDVNDRILGVQQDVKALESKLKALEDRLLALFQPVLAALSELHPVQAQSLSAQLPLPVPGSLLPFQPVAATETADDLTPLADLVLPSKA